MSDFGPGVNVRDVSASLGAEVIGLDARTISERGQLSAVKDLLYRKQLIVFRDQDLEPGELDTFTRHFGTPDQHVLTQFSLPGHPDIFVISNIVENGRPLGSRNEGFGWHTDLIYFQQPAACTILYAIEVPDEGAETLFASLYRAYDEMPEQEKAKLRSLKVTHSYKKMYYARPNVPPLTAEQEERTPDVTHPLVRLHPETGREGLYINRETVLGIEGLSAGETQQLVDRLFDWALQPRFRYSHKWKPRDLVIWDNRGALHTATPYDVEKYRRLLYRTSVRGEAPIAWRPRA